MDQEMRDYLDRMHKDIKDTVDDRFKTVEIRLRDQADQSLQSHEATRKQVGALGRMVTTLWREVKGSDPPPPEGGGMPPTAVMPMDEKLSEHDLTIAAIQGQIIAIDSKANAIKDDAAASKAAAEKALEKTTALEGQTKEALTLAKETKELNERQLKAMGVKTEAEEKSRVLTKLVDLCIWMFKEREGQKFALAGFAALTSLVTALGTTYAIITGRLPLPNSTPPTVQEPYARPLPSPPTPSPSASGGAQTGAVSPQGYSY